MHKLWRGIDAKLEYAEFQLDRTFKALIPKGMVGQTKANTAGLERLLYWDSAPVRCFKGLLRSSPNFAPHGLRTRAANSFWIQPDRSAGS